jgi:periplasmic divalent cation tolerance protein
MADDAISLAYITARDAAEAETIGRALVEERLAACVNILPGMRSLYRWDGAIERGEEAVLIAKTRRSRFPELAARVAQLHSYTTPCVLELAVGRGAPGYLAWLLAGTDAPAAG